MKPQYPTLTLDMKKYLGQLADWDITDTQKTEMIHALWGMLVSCAQIRLRIHPAQTIDHENSSNLLEDMVYSSHHPDCEQGRPNDA